MSGRRKSGGGGSGRKNNNKGKKSKKQQTPSGRGRGGNNNQRPRRSSLPNERTRNLDGASPTGRSFMREDAYFRMKFLEEQELLANMMRVNQRKRQKESPSRRQFKQRQQSDSESESSDSGSIDSDVVADYAMNISSDEDLVTINDSLKGLTADENFNVLRQYDEEIIGDEDDEESGESDEENQIKNQVSRFNLSKKVRKRREKKSRKRQNLVNAVVNKQNNRFVEPADFEDERPSLDAYLGTNREYYAQEDYYQVPEAVLSNADKLRNKYLKMLANTSFVRAKDPASFLEPAKDPSITTVTLTTTTTTSTMAPVNTDTIIQKVETISISKNNNEEVKTETVKIVEEKKEKPDVNMGEFKDSTPVLNEKLPEFRYEQVTELKIVTSTTPGNSNNNTPKQPTKNGKSPNKKNKNAAEPVEEKIEFEWVGEESDSDEDDEDDIVIDEDIEEDDEEDDEDDLSDVDVADLIVEDDYDEDEEDDEEDSDEDMPVQYVFDRNSGLSKKEQSLMLYWAQEDEMKRQAQRRNRRPAGSESEDSELSEEDLLDMQDIDDDESSEEDEQFTRILNSNYSPKDQRQFTPSPKGRRMPRDGVGFPDEERPSPSGRNQEKQMSAKERKLQRSSQPGVKTSKKKLKKLNKLYKNGNRKRRLTRNDIEYWSQIMVEFIKDQTMETKSVSNMNKFQLMQLAKLSKFYNLKASMAGSGKRRYAVINKTDHSRLRSEEDLKKFLNRFFPEEEEITRRNGDSRYGRSGSKTKVNTRKDMHTRVLVGNSQPIPESNVGHIMLLRMGWIGGGLGSQKQGIEEPIQPVIRPRGRGLGFNANSL